MVLRYTYDSLGALSRIQYTNGGGTWHNYYVRCTLSGDVDQIYSGSGNLVARYVYDTWGNTVSITDANGNAITSSTHIANINSIRYRGYYWDRETGFYYLQSRYYDTKTGRYVNPDGYVFTGQDMQSGNMYAYCGNNPTGRSDVEGSAYQVDYGGLNGSFGGSMLWPTYSMPVPIAPAIGVAVGSLAVATAAILTTAINPPQPWQMSSAALASYQASKAKAQSTDVATTTTKPRNDDIIIYRYGGTNPGNLTPRAKDRYTGLSFSTIPRSGAAMTTMEALNATGVVYAVQDGATHVSVRPVNGTMDDWISAGSNSAWTQAVKSTVIKWDG